MREGPASARGFTAIMRAVPAISARLGRHWPPESARQRPRKGQCRREERLISRIFPHHRVFRHSLAWFDLILQSVYIAYADAVSLRSWEAGMAARESKVLMIEADAQVSQSAAGYLGRAGYDVTALGDGLEALDYVRRRGLPHIALVGLSLSGMDGFEVARKLKSMADVPIIFVTSLDDQEAVAQGLKRYGEDFIVKPFALRELEARIQVALARLPSFDYVSEPIIRVDERLSIDFAHNRVVVNDKTIRLTPIESVLLYVLLRKAGQVVENRVLIARVWSGQGSYEDTLRVHMHRLRRKLEADTQHPYYIRTVRRIGYCFTQRPPDLFADRG